MVNNVMSLLGIVSLPVLLLSIVFIYFHAKFIRLFNACNKDISFLNEVLQHKFDLLMYFSQDLRNNQDLFADKVELLHGIKTLEDLLIEFDFSDEDSAELIDITKEIEEAQIMYNQSKEDFDSFASKFPGKLFTTFLADKSNK